MRAFVVIPRKYARFIEEEMALVKTVYSEVVGYLIVNNINARTYLSKEKINKLKELDFDKIIIMDKLKPSQFINLARELKRDLIDRILLILEIFASHAGSREALLQIELARLKYTLPLIKEAIRYAKLGELHGFLGAGRYGYEKYYLMLKRREANTRRELEKLRKVRSTRRRARLEAGLPHVVIVGYTCAGKTSLFNAITRLSRPVGPEPFTTLNPKAYRVEHNGLKFVLVDTVGFVRDIPPEVIESFYATLEEVAEADLVINVIDISKRLDDVVVEIQTGKDVLRKIGACNKPILYALNKVDRVENLDAVLRAISKHVDGDFIPVSCTMKINIDTLLNKIIHILRKQGALFGQKNIRAEVWA